MAPTNRQKANQSGQIFGWGLVVVGVLIVVFSVKIVFPGLERLVGIETIVGRENVVYEEDGRYSFTNPGAMVQWILAVAGVGVAVASVGVFLLFRGRRKEVRAMFTQGRT